MFFPCFGCLVLEKLISEMLAIRNSKISSTTNMTIVLTNITLFQRLAFKFFLYSSKCVAYEIMCLGQIYPKFQNNSAISD